MQAIDDQGRIFEGYAALAAAARGIPILLPLAFIVRVPALAALAERVYDLVAANRHRLGCGPSCRSLVPSATTASRM